MLAEQACFAIEMSRYHVAILDDESNRGLGRIKKILNERGRVVREGVGEKNAFLAPPYCRPLVPIPLCFQKGGLMLETLQAFAATKNDRSAG